MTINQARANMGAQLSDVPLMQPPDTVPFEAQIDPASGAITEGVLEVPEFSTSVPTSLTVDLEFKDITGSFSHASGALTLEGEADGRLATSGSECIVSTDPAILVLSTAGSSGGTSPRSGAPFTAGLAGEGAVAGQWIDMSATPVSPGDAIVCALVESNIGRPGGIWLAQEDDVAQLSAPQAPSAKTSSTSPPVPACIVPKLAGKTLARAKASLRAASCKLDKVRKPRQLKGSGRFLHLVVKSSNPSAGSSPADGKVDLRLGAKPGKARR
ncbi:MAG: PASTA domain-containing protein [Solirubrobacterales bacterium]